VEANHNDLLWKNISSLPYFRGFLRAVEGRYYQDIELAEPILDLGIGDGHFSAATLPGRVDVGIDTAVKSLQEAANREAGKILICGRGEKLPFSNEYFATVISNSVLEHIQQLEPVILEVSRVLKYDGSFIICVPNDNFTQNLSIARFLKKVNLKRLRNYYQSVFNKISRHYHPDPVDVWIANLENAGFKIIDYWNYFPPKSLEILEWGHLFGIPAWINKQLFGEWVLIKKMWYLWPVYKWLNKHYSLDQTSSDGAYSFFIMKKRLGC